MFSQGKLIFLDPVSLRSRTTLFKNTKLFFFILFCVFESFLYANVKNNFKKQILMFFLSKMYFKKQSLP